ncbi:MAG: glycosyltransferase [Chloroflexi bacterium]|nr:glycosyltransferase [Chloroflexota bacterium]
MAARPIRLLHLITDLDVGGAEMMLYKLLSGLDGGAFASEVVSLTTIGPLSERIRALGVPVSALGLRRRVPDPLPLARLVRSLRREPPDVVQTWMYHADLLGGLAAKLAGSMPVVWNVRQSNLSPSVNRRRTLLVVRLCARLSRWLPARVVCGSQAARQAHVTLGYDATKMRIIPNGFDLAVFKPDPMARAAVRCELGLLDDAPLIGLVARFDAQKDHRTFVQAAALLRRQEPDVHFALCGDGVTLQNEALAGWIAAAGLREHCHLLGRRDDVPRLTAALDIATSSSIGEGFPNAVGEAMACGVPCVVTAVGDSAAIVGRTGVVVPPRDRPALAAGWRALLALGPAGRRCLGQAARRRVAERFSLPAVVAQYERLYRELTPRSTMSDASSLL